LPVKKYIPVGLLKNDTSDLLADSHNILNRWKNDFFQLLNIRGVKNVRETEIHMAKPLGHKPSPFEVENAFKS
jgi:hypothetical protein